MDEDPDEIEQHISRARGDLNENLNELEEKVRSALDWRTQFEQRPMLMLGIALGGGMLASALVPSRRRRRRFTDYGANGDTRRFGHGTYRTGERTTERTGGPMRRESKKGDTMEALKGVLMSVAASKLGNVLSDLLSGYREEYSKSHEREQRYGSSRSESQRTH